MESVVIMICVCVCVKELDIFQTTLSIVLPYGEYVINQSKELDFYKT